MLNGIIATTVTAVVTLLAAGQDPAVFELPVIDGQAEPAVQVEAPAPTSDCAVVEIIEDDDGDLDHGGYLTYPFQSGELRTSIVGRYLWVQWDRPWFTDADSTAADIGSIELGGPGTVEICR